MNDRIYDAALSILISLPVKQRNELIERFTVKPKIEATTVAAPTPTAILTRRQTAARFNRHPIFIDRLVKKRLLHRVIMPGSKRGCGFRTSEVECLIQMDGGITRKKGSK